MLFRSLGLLLLHRMGVEVLRSNRIRRLKSASLGDSGGGGPNSGPFPRAKAQSWKASRMGPRAPEAHPAIQLPVPAVSISAGKGATPTDCLQALKSIVHPKVVTAAELVDRGTRFKVFFVSEESMVSLVPTGQIMVKRVAVSVVQEHFIRFRTLLTELSS